MRLQEENKKLKQKQKDKMQPKMGKLDIDYQVLHDAFFKHQNKPSFSIMGDLYYEGKEFEARVRPQHTCSLCFLAGVSNPQRMQPYRQTQKHGAPPSPNIYHLVS